MAQITSLLTVLLQYSRTLAGQLLRLIVLSVFIVALGNFTLPERGDGGLCLSLLLDKGFIPSVELGQTIDKSN